MARSVLVVEDDNNIADLLRMYLEKEGFSVRIAGDGGTAQSIQPRRIARRSDLGARSTIRFVKLPFAFAPKHRKNPRPTRLTTPK